MESRPAHMPATSLVDRLMDNSNRRQYGMGIVGRMTRFLLARLALSAPLAWPGLHSFKGRHELDVSSKLISFIGKNTVLSLGGVGISLVVVHVLPAVKGAWRTAHLRLDYSIER